MKYIKLRTIAAFIMSAVATFAQSSQQPDQNSPTVLLYNEGASGSTHQYINGRLFKTLTGNGFTISVGLRANKELARVDVSILNSSKANVDVFPVTFTLNEVAPKERILLNVDPDELMQAIKTRDAWFNALTALGAAAPRRTTTRTTSTGTIHATGSDGSYASGTYNGSATSTTYAPNYAAQAQASQTIQERNAQASALSEQMQTALRVNTIAPAENVAGFVLFEMDKKARIVTLTVPVGGTVYKFPFEIIKEK